jgi:hypothetical protein
MGLETSDASMTKIPDELAGPTPREVSLSGSLPAALTWIVLLFLGGGGIFLGLWGVDTFQQSLHRMALRSDGRVVDGVVTGLTHGRGPSFVSYAFVVDNVHYSGRVQVSGPDPRKSDLIAVRYLPSGPAINHPAAWEWSPLMQIMAAPFSLFIIGFGVWTLAHIRRDRKLAREGKPAQGVVSRCSTEKGTYQVEYEFRTEDGEHVSGASDCQDSCETGQNIWVLYLPQKPSKNHAYPLSDYDIVG